MTPNPARRHSLLLLGFTLVLASSEALVAQPPDAHDHVTLAEIVPALRGSELGALAIVTAPAPGNRRVVRREEVLAAIRAAGQEARGLVIPRSTTIVRGERVLEGHALEALLRPAVTAALAPCEVLDLRGPPRLSIGDAAPRLEAQLARPLREDASVSGVVRVVERGREQRISVRARVQCPAPAVQPGSRVRIVVQIGAIRASAPGVARQPGRVGDEIRVFNEATRATLLGRIREDGNVEVSR